MHYFNLSLPQWFICLIAIVINAPIAFAEAPQATSQIETPPCCIFDPEVAALEKLLKQYKEIADNGGWPEWKQGKKIELHHQDTRIPTLRQLLTITGDYNGASGDETQSLHYDDGLLAAVKRFQSRHGLNPYGTIGKSTQTALAVPVEKRIIQIVSTMERIRSRAQGFEPKFILVNLPAFTLFAVEKGKTALTMRVIIGNRQNHTPLFDNEVTDVVFNPQWHVPERIAKNELIPKLRQNPDYFINAGFVVTQDGEPVDLMHVPDGDHFSFRQQAGAGNALGKIKFNIPDSDDIYLHSTATPRLFALDDRALSHGCIRLENPRALAHFVMNGVKDWDEKRIDTAYDSRKERSVKVAATPVHLVYWTAFVDAGGVAHFFNDVYGMDHSMSAERKQAKTFTLALKE